MTLPPLPAIGSARIEIFGPSAGAAKWDEGKWDSATWPGVDWLDITPESVAVTVSWGADDPSGVLTVPAAGSWLVHTYDPQRLLDPSNGSSDFATSIRPGKPIRVSYINAIGERKIVRQGLIDEVDFDLTKLTGTLRGTDSVQLLVAAKVPENQTGVPLTLRALARHLISKVGLTLLVPVEATPDGEIDPPVGPVVANEVSTWQHILTASLDALYAVWMDRTGTLRFRSFGNPQDAGFQAGGVDGIPISTMQTQASLQGVFTHIVAFDDSAPTVAVEAIDNDKVTVYGDLTLKREQPVPDARVWVDSVLADRSGASLQYVPGTLYPQTEDDLESIITLGMVDIAHLVVDAVDPTIDIAARVLGGKIIGDTGTGWSAELLTYIPAKEWEEAELPEPPIPPIPPDVIHGVVRTYTCTKDARLAHSSSLDAGNGLDVNIPIGYISPYRNRAVLGFTGISWSGVVSVDKAELLVTVGASTCGAFGSEPKVNVSRLTGSFSEGTYDVNCGFGTGNAVKYPGPATTSSGSVTAAMPKNTGSQKSIDITAIARAWFSGQPQHGLMIKSAGEDASKWTTAIYARHHGTAGNRPSLKLTLTVKA
jgi:hypothetical protein